YLKRTFREGHAARQAISRGKLTHLPTEGWRELVAGWQHVIAYVCVPTGTHSGSEATLRQEECIKSHGGYLVRMLATLNGFRAKYGSWPTRLLLGADALA